MHKNCHARGKSIHIISLTLNSRNDGRVKNFLVFWNQSGSKSNRCCQLLFCKEVIHEFMKNDPQIITSLVVNGLELSYLDEDATIGAEFLSPYTSV